MHESRAFGEGRVDTGDDERGRGDAAPDAEPVADALGQGGLPGPQGSGEHDEVPGAQPAGEPAPERAHLCGGPHDGLVDHCHFMIAVNSVLGGLFKSPWPDTAPPA